MSSDIIRETQELKVLINEDSTDKESQLDIRLKLQKNFRKLLITDLEFSLDEKIEQDLWNLVYKKPITKLQVESKDKSNPKKSEAQSNLSILLHAASGFYHQLISELCSIYNLDLPFRSKAAKIGILKEYSNLQLKTKSAKKSSCLYICQDCLVHLGDLARYRQQNDQSDIYYRFAVSIVPSNGQPYNQLAILEAMRGNKLATAFLHIRSICIKHPFAAASTNLEKFYLKIIRENNDLRPDATAKEVIHSFLNLQAMFHLKYEMPKLRQKYEQILSIFPTLLSGEKWDQGGLNGSQLIQIFAICIYSLTEETKKIKGAPKTSNLEKLQQNRSGFMLHVLVTLLDQIIIAVNKSVNEEAPIALIQTIKVVFDWLRIDSHHLQHPITIKTLTWASLATFLNNISLKVDTETLNNNNNLSLPLPEDYVLHYFLPIHKAYRDVDFMTDECKNDDVVDREIRFKRILMTAKAIAASLNKPSLFLVEVGEDGKYNFSSDSKSMTNHPRQNVAIQAIMKNTDRLNNVANNSQQHIPDPNSTADRRNPDLTAAEESGQGIEANADSLREDSYEKIKGIWEWEDYENNVTGALPINHVYPPTNYIAASLDYRNNAPRFNPVYSYNFRPGYNGGFNGAGLNFVTQVPNSALPRTSNPLDVSGFPDSIYRQPIGMPTRGSAIVDAFNQQADNKSGLDGGEGNNLNNPGLNWGVSTGQRMPQFSVEGIFPLRPFFDGQYRPDAAPLWPMNLYRGPMDRDLSGQIPGARFFNPATNFSCNSVHPPSTDISRAPGFNPMLPRFNPQMNIRSGPTVNIRQHFGGAEPGDDVANDRERFVGGGQYMESKGSNYDMFKSPPWQFNIDRIHPKPNCIDSTSITGINTNNSSIGVVAAAISDNNWPDENDVSVSATTAKANNNNWPVNNDNALVNSAPNFIPSIWSVGSSPLEKLLQLQKNSQHQESK